MSIYFVHKEEFLCSLIPFVLCIYILFADKSERFHTAVITKYHGLADVQFETESRKGL